MERKEVYLFPCNTKVTMTEGELEIFLFEREFEENKLEIAALEKEVEEKRRLISEAKQQQQLIISSGLSSITLDDDDDGGESEERRRQYQQQQDAVGSMEAELEEAEGMLASLLRDQESYPERLEGLKEHIAWFENMLNAVRLDRDRRGLPSVPFPW